MPLTLRSITLFRPLLAGARPLDRLLAGIIGAIIGISLTMAICAQLPLSAGDLPIVVAPIGASAVLVFAVPASPLAQPWSVVGGNIISALVGVTIARYVPNIFLAAGLAVGGAILLMSLLRCLHPPGGASALTAVIGSAVIHDAGYAFAFAPVGINSIALVSLGMFFHRMSGRSYPHVPPLDARDRAVVNRVAGLHAEDMDRALADMDESFDISRADLELLLAQAEIHAKARQSH